MQLSIPKSNLKNYVYSLLRIHFPDGNNNNICDSIFDHALDRLEHCFKHINKKYYIENGNPIFNHLHSDHFSSFLWFLGNSSYLEFGNNILATKLSYLNKIMHGIDLYHTVNLPDIFLLVHPVGSVIGNARFQDYLVIYQNVTIGATTNVYPQLGHGVALFSRSSIIGDCTIGNNVIFGANSFIINTNITDDKCVVGSFPDIRIYPARTNIVSDYFNDGTLS